MGQTNSFFSATNLPALMGIFQFEKLNFTITIVNNSMEEKQTTNKGLALFTIIVPGNYIWSFKLEILNYRFISVRMFWHFLKEWWYLFTSFQSETNLIVSLKKKVEIKIDIIICGLHRSPWPLSFFHRDEKLHFIWEKGRFNYVWDERQWEQNRSLSQTQ